jgi:hypothetical protein
VVGIEAVKRILTGVVTASALLHFYYDGFIWKVRENRRDNLWALPVAQLLFRYVVLCPAGLCTARNGSLFVIPLGMLWFAEVHSAEGKLQRLSSIVADLPTSARAHVNYAPNCRTLGELTKQQKNFPRRYA